MHLYHPKPSPLPGSWKNCPLQKVVEEVVELLAPRFLAPKRLRSTALGAQRRHHVERKGPLALVPWALSSEMQFRGQSIEIKIHSRKTVFQFHFPSLKFSNPAAAGGDS